MSAFPLASKTAAELAALLAAGSVSARQIAEDCIGAARADDAKPDAERIGAFLSFDADDFLAQADASDARRAAGGALGPLDGIPVAIKDNIAVRGQPLSCASKILAPAAAGIATAGHDYRSPYDATVIARLRAAGALVWGRLNMDEFAMGSSTENSAFKKTRNPRDISRVPGGSSGGSAAAVAAGMTPLALGSDTGGSIRQPAAFCGVVGMKPTYGCVSRYGLAAFASSLDQIGPVARTVADAKLLLDAIAGSDPRDGTALKGVVSGQWSVASGRCAVGGEAAAPLRIGVPVEFFGEGLDGGVRAAVEGVIAFYKERGCEIREISLPAARHAVATYYIIATAEASSNLARYDGIRYGHRSPRATDALDIYSLTRAEGFGDEVKRRIILGTYVLSSGYYDAYYVKAQKVRTLIRRDFMRAFGLDETAGGDAAAGGGCAAGSAPSSAAVDLILSPVSPTPPPLLGANLSPLETYLADIYTIPVNLAGLPAISVPCRPTAGAAGAGDGSGDAAGALPVGFQLIGRPLDEATLFDAAALYERG
ncbi:MAG: Asp-tRNA(Asn)/Glu-tRNA(Gln) amidotransferase subunit GatA [Puniceicoccales bacterium]|jgi:aspartyl-tRNA(Asn)/glutamyl-tRNA(Gln) amidotransferase subunit A|nr:Asp-tRNA(Asn)/Glu-tRNA(Gln) amidotransferase subunit GatA [Puniceicoccales bacterium]